MKTKNILFLFILSFSLNIYAGDAPSTYSKPIIKENNNAAKINLSKTKKAEAAQQRHQRKYDQERSSGIKRGQLTRRYSLR